MQYIVISDNLAEIMLLQLAVVTKTTQNPLYFMFIIYKNKWTKARLLKNYIHVYHYKTK